ncbi:ParB/RepB/Spo0J family partition protein [Acidiphilium multivorum]|uniref:ParB/RepB/Spo0J family partition protein n=1 Tax=Acidiphilium TaxID=522 RepID=UPI002583113B|nr:ParB/RepB/Spo0J family partition protein [Acidiphilium sp.]
MATTEFPVSGITADTSYQPRTDGLDLTHVQMLETIPDAWPPLRIVRNGDRFILVDGFHRFAAAQNLGLETVPVEILDPPPDGDLFGLAFALNAAHGRPLNLSDRRAFAARLLQAAPETSDREIGRRAGLSQPTVAKVRRELEARDDIAPAESRVGRDGRAYRTSTVQDLGRPQGGISLTEALSNLFTPAERRTQRKLVRYFERVADLLEEQERLDGFGTIRAAADACRAVLGDEEAEALAARLGWSSRNVTAVAEALGDLEEPAAP